MDTFHGLYQSIPSFIHVSSPVRQPWYIKDSPHSHQSSPEEDSSLSQNIEIKATSLSTVKVSTMERGPIAVTMDTLATSQKHPTSLLLTTEAPPAYC